MSAKVSFLFENYNLGTCILNHCRRTKISIAIWIIEFEIYFFTVADFDLDSYALLLGENGKLNNYKEDVIYYSNLESKDKAVVHSGDNLTGAGDGDDEQILVKLSSLSAQYHKIIFGVNIYNGKERKQHFGLVENAFVRAVDAAGKEIARYRLSNDPSYEGKLNMLIGEVYREGGEWKFKAVGNPLAEDFNGVVGSFIR